MSDHTPYLAGHLAGHALRASLAALAVFAAVPALAQQVQDIAPAATQPPLIALPVAGQKPVPASSTASPPVVAEVDLGQAGTVAAGASPAPVPQGVAARAAAAARDSGTSASSGQAAPIPRAKPAAKNTNRAAASSGTAAPSDRPGVERAVFNRQPVRVGLPVQRERLITLPGPAALHVPADIESVARVEAIDRTIYVTALVPFAPIRIVAELIDGGRQIPLDLVANAQTSGASAELEVFLDRAGSREASAGAAAATEAGPPAADMVELTRFASRMLYAPRRLATTRPGISQVQVSTKPVPGLVRGGLVETVPLGQWRSAGLYVTAVRVTNKSAQPFELPLEHLRGRWLAVTAQHGRIGPAGSETDTTALYLICDRAFDACL
ncbi:MAG: TIGR03749 family integrating conjugative element protein [Hydrogenophaga sp.]|nr:TIGR03749 family integrating conjugative element protein [Hydrogenophaga sp.]